MQLSIESALPKSDWTEEQQRKDEKETREYMEFYYHGWKKWNIRVAEMINEAKEDEQV